MCLNYVKTRLTKQIKILPLNDAIYKFVNHACNASGKRVLYVYNAIWGFYGIIGIVVFMLLSIMKCKTENVS